MTPWQKAIKYATMAFACLLCISIFSGIISFFGAVFITTPKTTDKLSVTPIEKNIADMEIDLKNANLQIVTGSKFSVETNIKNLSVTQKGATLKITEKGKFINFGANDNTAEVIVTVPTDKTFDDVELDIGATKTKIEQLKCNELNLDLGAGAFFASDLICAKSADIDGGAGNIVIADSSIYNADIEVGAGNAEIESYLFGNSKLSVGVGKAEVALLGGANYYSIKTSKGIGTATIDGKKVDNAYKYPYNGDNSIKVECGVGKVDIDFKK